MEIRGRNAVSALASPVLGSGLLELGVWEEFECYAGNVVGCVTTDRSRSDLIDWIG